MAERKADVENITKVESKVPAHTNLYEIPIYQKMTLRDGGQADVLVQRIRVTKQQLVDSIANTETQLSELKAKLKKIEELEG